MWRECLCRAVKVRRHAVPVLEFVHAGGIDVCHPVAVGIDAVHVPSVFICYQVIKLGFRKLHIGRCPSLCAVYFGIVRMADIFVSRPQGIIIHPRFLDGDIFPRHGILAD